MPEYDYCFKVILIGDTGVGKTSLLNRFADDFYSAEFIATIGVDFKIRMLPVDDKRVRIQFWDTAGQERFRSITTCYFRSSNGVIVVYDVCNKQSFVNIAEWMRTVQDYCSENVVKMIIGNKCDCDPSDRQVSMEQGKRLAIQYGAIFAETSAQSDVNVRRTFLELARLLKKQSDDDADARTSAKQWGTNPRLFDDHDKNDGKTSCCKLM